MIHDKFQLSPRTHASPVWYAFVASASLTLGQVPAGQAMAQGASTSPDVDIAPTCTIEARLSGAMYDATRPERSFALVQLHASQRGQMYRVGMKIGDYALIAIEPRGILLQSAKGECWLRLVGSPDRAQRASPPPRKKKARRLRKPNEPESR